MELLEKVGLADKAEKMLQRCQVATTTYCDCTFIGDEAKGLVV